MKIKKIDARNIKMLSSLTVLKGQSMQTDTSGYSDKGLVREGNEDSFVVAPEIGFFAVADGMGGHNAGEVASRMAIDVLRDYLERTTIGGSMPGNGKIPIIPMQPTILHPEYDMQTGSFTSQPGIIRHGGTWGPPSLQRF